MTVKRKKKGGFSGGRTLTVAFSLCLLAIVAMIGMYTVGKSDQQQKELEQKVAEAEEEARAREQAQAQADAKREQEAEEQREQEETQAASGNAARDKEGEALADAGEGRGETGTADGTAASDGAAAADGSVDGAELESEFADADPDPAGTGETVILDEAQAAASAGAAAEQAELSFSPETDQLLWPVAGNVLMDYSMDKSVYFATLDQYKYNPAIIIQGTLDENVMSAAPGKITKIETLEETGMTVTMDIGDGYEVIYGQLKELPVKEGDYLQAGETVGYVSEPTRFYTKEGCNVYFEVRKDGESVDPMALLQ